MDGGAQVCFVESGDGGQEFRFRLTENRQGVENDPGSLVSLRSRFCTAAASVVCLMSSLPIAGGFSRSCRTNSSRTSGNPSTAVTS